MNIEKDIAFIVTKPLQMLVAFSIIKQFELSLRIHFVILDSFFDAQRVHERISAEGGQFKNLTYYFCESHQDAFRTIVDIPLTRLFIDSDVGFQRFTELARLKIQRPNLDIAIYEEGLGTYRQDLYFGAKRRVFQAFGIGTHFGASMFTSDIFVYQPELYAASFYKSKVKIHLLKHSPAEILRTDQRRWENIFGYIPPAAPESAFCNLYLTGWTIAEDFLNAFQTLQGDKYIKLHPHIRLARPITQVREIIRSVPAELMLIDFAARYQQVNVYHHGSSVERYFSGSNVAFHELDTLASSNI